MSSPGTSPAHSGPSRLDPVVRHLYVHVPFCPTICPYCDFHVLTRRAGLVERYLARLDEEAAQLAQTYAVDLDTVYLGGGTPSFLRDDELQALVSSVQTRLGWGRRENTLEVNPGTVSPARAAHWQTLGFDRASVGVQSLHDPTLTFLGRQHTAAQAADAVRTLVARGLRVSGDLITAVPGQPLDDDIHGLLALGVGHVSAYTLTIEPGTEFARRGVTVHEDDERRGFERTEALLTAAGFTRYEISNYARPGQESQHNLAYWHGRTYLGLGPGGAGHYPALPGGDGRWSMVDGKGADGGWPMADGEGQDKAAQGAPLPTAHTPLPTAHFPLPTPHPPLTFRRTNPHLHEWLTGEAGEAEAIFPHDYVTDALFMGLRLRAGLDLADLSRRSGVDVAGVYAAPIAENVAGGLLQLEGHQLRATPQGWWVLNRVVTDFLDAAPGGH
ncbi:radical SAM family heme chaperone HemW [Deinococcus multiflagellatus]|uniref:radical SAM family heme chaperone HemW n=1 Tax=Deinococcus multiflagellatus TaxID=1656887 RepID=UPI001CCCF393|nr:radical SAM family heme chaperone HemW [Deinococcus multiflagellatus]MBZ9715736.1 radical SAM family heme chaperone HemW [Deinococcus multiflagellatus]